MDHIKVKAPATSANLGSGFDVFGIALQAPYDIIELEPQDVTEIKVDGVGRDLVPTDPAKNTAGITASELGCNAKITVHKGIRPCSGLGSSAASAAGAALGLNELFDLGLSENELIRAAVKGEKVVSGTAHADNVAAALLGGFTIVNGENVIQLEPPDIGIIAILPDISVETRAARSILPPKVPLEDLVFNIGNASSLVLGMVTGNLELIGRSMQDRIITPVRSKLIPCYEDVRESALEAGAAGATISGSGPAMIAVCELERRGEIADAMVDAFSRNGIKSEPFITQPGGGAEIVKGMNER
ncbi:MAG: homoserine kinase [Methanocellales archaeon]|nr:homoserine kinase [Methanocellales archaeon]MDD3292177.1 homoserine kinase [Methanocellales archaeon]MDD5235756.1 homoserine kinase [Methanocellales archaeon]MDD5485821.1 homoserine kinase [Methanocellales archaeon]